MQLKQISNKKTKNYIKKIKKILSNKEIQIISPKISLDKLAKIIVYGMIRNLILREIRATYISFLVLNGWGIHNPSQETCDRWLKKRKDIIQFTNSLSNLLDNIPMPPDVKEEFLQVKQQITKNKNF